MSRACHRTKRELRAAIRELASTNEALKAGFERLLVKPVDPDELDRVLNALLRS